MPSDFTLKAMNAVHRALLKASFGRMGWSVQRMPVVELTTTGRRTGRPHTVMLTSPARHHGNLVIVASRGGDDRHPAWFLNLRDHPDATVTTRGTARPARARIATPQEKAEIWPGIAADHDNYAAYQRRTDRDIPLVILESPTT